MDTRYVNSESSPHELLNDAREWLQYAQGTTQLLADLVHESDAVDCRLMALALEGVRAMTQVGMHCVAEAHTRMFDDRITGRATDKEGAGA
jgi:hypothetical protein